MGCRWLGTNRKRARRLWFTRVNVDEIADAAGITKRTLYSHFDSKDSLLESVLEEQHDLAFEAFQTFGHLLEGTPEKIVRTFLLNYPSGLVNPDGLALDLRVLQ